MRITNLCLIIGIAISILACQATEQNPPKPTETQVVMVGNDRDKHGCKASAGYIWSELKGECVRIWEVGSPIEYRLNQQGEVHKSFLIMSADSTQLEFFYQGQQLFNRVEGTLTWQNSHRQQLKLLTNGTWLFSE